MRCLTKASMTFSTFFLLLGFLYGGGIKGTVKFDGKAPKMKPIKMSADPICDGKHSDGPARAEWLLSGSEGELKNVFVYIEKGLEGKSYKTPEKAVTIDQTGCVYVPHVLGLMVGQQLDILNSDGTLHNIHALPKVNKEFNKAMPRSKKLMSVTFDKAEAPFKVKCDVHPWMGAFLGVFDHPYFAVTDDSGSYTISGLAPGKYVIEAWHEKLGSQIADITVDDSGASQDFTFKKPSKKK